MNLKDLNEVATKAAYRDQLVTVIEYLEKKRFSLSHNDNDMVRLELVSGVAHSFQVNFSQLINMLHGNKESIEASLAELGVSVE